MKCIITEKIHEDGIKLLKEQATVDIRYDISRDELLNCIKDYEVLIIRSDTAVNKELLDVAENLRVVGMAGIGLNHVDVEYAKEKGIAVFNVNDGSNDSVTELTVGMMINIARKVYLGVRDTKNGLWDKTGYTGNQLKGKTLGLVAMGKIGSKVAKICQTLGMDVIAYDPYLNPSIAAEMNVELYSLENVLKSADFISIHSPLTEETYHMIGEKELSMMKIGAYIVNLGRGGIIDEDALYNALKGDKLAGAAVDVMEMEPPGDSRLFSLDNFISTPHLGAGTIEAQQYISVSIANKILEYLNSVLVIS